MKKWIAVLAALMLCLSVACAEEGEAAFTPTDSNVLVACFSATGNTWQLAEYAADYLNADLFRIEPEEPYTDADLNYNNNSSRANREMEDDTCRPALAATVENMPQYDTVILAFPIWWGQAPRIIETFIEAPSFLCGHVRGADAAVASGDGHCALCGGINGGIINGCEADGRTRRAGRIRPEIRGFE